MHGLNNEFMETNVSEMSLSDLRKFVLGVVDERLLEVSDPDHGLELRDDFREMLIQRSKDFNEGKLATVSLDVLADLGIDRSEIETEENVSA